MSIPVAVPSLREPGSSFFTQQALSTELHLAVVSGPDCGLCFPLFPQGSSFLGRISGLSDLAISRRHLQMRLLRSGREKLYCQLRLCPGAGAVFIRRGWRLAWLRPNPLGGNYFAKRWRKFGVGSRFYLGSSVLELRSRPADLRFSLPEHDPTRSSFFRGGFIRFFWFLPSLFFISYLGFYAWRLALLLFFLLVIGGFYWFIFRRRSRLDPADLLLAASCQPAQDEVFRFAQTVSSDSFSGNTSAFKDPSSTALVVSKVFKTKGKNSTVVFNRGDVVAVVGSKAKEAVNWWTGQALVSGAARLHPDSILSGCSFAQSFMSSLFDVTGSSAGSSGVFSVLISDFSHTETGVVNSAASPDLVFLPCSDAQIPPCCNRVISVSTRASLPGFPWFSQLCLLLAARAKVLSLNSGNSFTTPPSKAAARWLSDLTIEQVSTVWEKRHDGLFAQLGLDSAHLPFSIDLQKDGPHALVAGTTGCGKSELLVTWLLSLAARYDPGRLAFVLVDYKGGAAFGKLTQLPHCCGVLTDLIPGLTERALQSLQAVLQYREVLLREVNATDLDDYSRITGKSLPRIVIVIDEYRAVVNGHPQLCETLTLLATQGRSLGLHLILATQKPSGVVSGQIFSNVNLRIALRMRSESDSVEVLGDAGAAKLPAVPGRALISEQETHCIQVGYLGDQVSGVVDLLTQAWQSVSGDCPWRPWKDPLPTSIESPAIDTVSKRVPHSFALLDLPVQGKQLWWDWDGEAILFAGTPGSGRSTALLSLLASLYTSSSFLDSASSLEKVPWQSCFVVSRYVSDFVEILAERKIGGQCFDFSEHWPWYQFLSALRHSASIGGTAFRNSILLIDGLEHLIAFWENGSDRGYATEELRELLSSARRCGMAVAASCDLENGHSSWATFFTRRVVLGARDQIHLAQGGIEPSVHSLGSAPRYLLPTEFCAGRAIFDFGTNADFAKENSISNHISGSIVVEGQIVLPPKRQVKANDLIDHYQQQPFPNKNLSLSRCYEQVLKKGMGVIKGQIVPGWTSLTGSLEGFSADTNWLIYTAGTSAKHMVEMLSEQYRDIGYEICYPGKDGSNFSSDGFKLTVFQNELELLAHRENPAVDFSDSEISRSSNNYLVVLPLSTYYSSRRNLPTSMFHNCVTVTFFDGRPETLQHIKELCGSDVLKLLNSPEWGKTPVILTKDSQNRILIPQYATV